MSDSDGFGAFFAGFVIGGLVGAAASLILAPQSGEETRAQIQERGIEIQTRAQETLQEARKKADLVIADAQERGKVILEEQRGRIGEGGKLLEKLGQKPAEEALEDTPAEDAPAEAAA